MNTAALIIAVAISGVATLFFFPEPETNSLAYAGTALFFFILILALLLWHENRKKR